MGLFALSAGGLVLFGQVDGQAILERGTGVKSLYQARPRRELQSRSRECTRSFSRALAAKYKKQDDNRSSPLPSRNFRRRSLRTGFPAIEGNSHSAHGSSL